MENEEWKGVKRVVVTQRQDEFAAFKCGVRVIKTNKKKLPRHSIYVQPIKCPNKRVSCKGSPVFIL